MKTRSILIRYIFVFLATTIALAILSVGFEMFLHISISTSVSFGAIFVPALDAGLTYARKEKSMPEKGYMWKMSLWFTIINIGLGLLLAGVVFQALGQLTALFSASAAVSLTVWSVALGVMFLICWVASRYFFGFGAKTILKVQEKQALKEQAS